MLKSGEKDHKLRPLNRKQLDSDDQISISLYKEYIFTGRQPFASCHASSLVLLPDQSILAVWFGGSAEGAEDVSIWCARRKEEKWSQPTLVVGKSGRPHWNPVLFYRSGAPLFLFYKVGESIPVWETWVQTSSDFGQIWSLPQPLVAGDRGGRGPVKNKPICISNGSWLAPASLEGESWSAFVDISQDKGQSWDRSSLITLDCTENPSPLPSSNDVPNLAQGVIQPTLWESKPGNIHMLLRSTTGFIMRSDSQDYGQTWGTAYPTVLPNNNSGIDLTCLHTGELVLAYNPVGENWGRRTPLVLGSSQDNGHSWEQICTLEDGDGEYSYPALVSQGNIVYITYTWNRKRIGFGKIEITR